MIYGVLFVAGAIVHLLYLYALLRMAPLDTWNWSHADTKTYIGPAESFLQTGIFARYGEPDCFRPVGYPFFLSGALKLGVLTGVDWRIIAYVAQAIVFALSYPVIFFLARDVFGLTRLMAIECVGFTIFSGAFISYVPIIMSDAMFASTLLTGMAFSFYALQRQSILWSLLYITIITCSATVRPMLGFYPAAAVLMHWTYVQNRYQVVNRFRFFLMIFMLVFALIGVQAPALRNWINVGVFTPSESGSIALYDYLAKDVLGFREKAARYEQIHEVLIKQEHCRMLGSRIALRKKEAMGVYFDFPLETASFMFYYGMLNSIETHWNNTLFYLFRQTWYRDYADGSVRWSPVPFVIAIFFIVVYGYIYAAALILLVAMRKNMWLIASILLFLAPFAFCATNYQGARFRLWFEPFIVMAAAVIFQKAHVGWSLHRQVIISQYIKFIQSCL